MISCTTNLMVRDVGKSIDFYQNVCNLECIDAVKNESGITIFAILKHEGMTLMLEEQETLIQEYPTLETRTIKPSLTLFIKVESIIDMLHHVQQHTEIIKPLNNTFYGTTEFAVIDPDGYVLTFSGKTHE